MLGLKPKPSSTSRKQEVLLHERRTRQAKVRRMDFVSHSHRDLEKVRHFRDELGTAWSQSAPVLPQMPGRQRRPASRTIRDEIKSRERFILCESVHSKNSSWVQQEVELIREMEVNIFETIDLSKDLETELHKVVRLSKRATVFLSYASADHATADAIRRALMLHEFTVTTLRISARRHSHSKPLSPKPLMMLSHEGSSWCC